MIESMWGIMGGIRAMGCAHGGPASKQRLPGRRIPREGGVNLISLSTAGPSICGKMDYEGATWGSYLGRAPPLPWAGTFLWDFHHHHKPIKLRVS